MRIHAFVIGWTGMEQRYRTIIDGLKDVVEQVHLVYSASHDLDESDLGTCIQVPESWFYGKKIKECLAHNSGDVMLIVQADAQFNHWPQLVDRARYSYASVPRLGVWAPDVDHTYYPTERVQIGHLIDTSHVLVTQTDGIVWSFSRAVAERLNTLNFEQNNLGWGTEWAAICYAMANNLLVVRDTSLKVIHKQGRHYDGQLAAAQKQQFLTQLSISETVQYHLLVSYNQLLNKRLETNPTNSA